MSLRNFLYGSYWFLQPDPAKGRVIAFYVVILLVLVLAGIVAMIVRQREKIKSVRLLYQRVGAFGFTMGLSGLLLFWFRQKEVFFLGWRLWYALWLVIALIWLYRLLHYAFKRIPVIKAEHEERALKEKYLP